MADIRFINKNRTSVDIAVVRKRFFDSAIRPGVHPDRASAIWEGAMRGGAPCAVCHRRRLRYPDRQQHRGFRIPVMRLPKWSALIVAAMTFSSSAFAAGVDSRAYTCDGLHALVAANRFVFINYPSFMDFVVANSSYCSGGEIIQLRSVPTSDNPECLVNRCRNRSGSN